MITLIMSIIFCATGTLLSLSGYKRHIQATEKLERVKAREERLKELAKPPVSYCTAINFDRSCVIVGAKYWGRGWLCDVNFKEFAFDPTDSEGRKFAIREADELMEKLREK